MEYTRRQIGKLALSAIPAASFLPRAAWAADKPDSKVNGVVIGMNVPYNFGNQATSAEDILQRCVQLGVSELLAFVQPANEPSIRLFDRAGYRRTGEADDLVELRHSIR